MRKLTVSIEGDYKEVQLDESILVIGDSRHLLVKTAVVYWKYNSVFIGLNDRCIGYPGRVTLTEGSWSFQMLPTNLKTEKVILKASRVKGKYTMQCSDPPIFLGRLGELFCLPSNTTIQVDTETESPGKAEIYRGLRYVEVCCNIVDRSRVIDPYGKQSNVISTLPVTADGALKGTVAHYKDIESRVPISKCAFNAVRFNVRTNDSKVVGSVLFGFYLM